MNGMNVERIECADADDERVAAYRDLRDGELLRARGLFVAEGRMVVRRLIEDGRYALQSVLLNDAALNDLTPWLGRLHPSIPILVCRTTGFEQLTGFNIHRGCLALVRRPQPTPLTTVIAAATLLVVLEGVTNADNVGGVFRNAAAFAASGVLLSPTTCDPLYRKAIRTSMGAALQVPFARASGTEWPSALPQLRAAGFSIVALTPREPAESLDAFGARPRPARIALVIGTEGGGLSPEIESTADYRVKIPISDRVDSLNLAVAAGIALSRLTALRS